MMEKILPSNWKWRSLGELSSAIQYGYTAKAEPEPIGPKLLRITDIQNDAVNWKDVPFCQVEDAEKEKYLLGKNDLVFARTGATVGKSYLVSGSIPQAVFASYLIRVRLRDEVSPKYVAYFFKSADYWHQISVRQAGIGQPNVNGKKLAQIRIPIAPFEKQQQIVAEIEKQFSRLDEAVANLKRVKANLKRYRTAVLKAAVEGKLTEDWRKQHPNLEPASGLLERILTERRSKGNGRGKYKEPSAPETTDLPSPPKEWAWASLEMIGQHDRPIIYGIIKPGPHIPNGVRYVRVTEMKNGRVDVKNLKRTSPERAAKFARATLAPGDVLISKDGTIGRVAVVPPELEGGNITQHVMRAPIHSMMVRSFVVWAIRSDLCQRWLTGETRGVALQGVNVEDFRRLPIPIPSHEEQKQIVVEVERRLSVIDELEARIEVNLTRADRLRQSILAMSFSGRLTGLS